MHFSPGIMQLMLSHVQCLSQSACRGEGQLTQEHVILPWKVIPSTDCSKITAELCNL